LIAGRLLDFHRRADVGKLLANRKRAPKPIKEGVRKRSYDRFCTSIRFGIGMEVLIFEKSTLSRREPFDRFGINNCPFGLVLEKFGETMRHLAVGYTELNCGTMRLRP
jgi:hypothetical protein